MSMTTVTRLCDVEDCDRAKVAFGLCESHRARLAKYGPIREDWPPIRAYSRQAPVRDELTVSQDRAQQDVLGVTLYRGDVVEYLRDREAYGITYAIIRDQSGEELQVPLSRLDWISAEPVAA